ncbi:polyribonucleotide nucleotidyltransferase [Candidatus Marinamargulisbacteria bacterium SCGC AG-439-L15]|nr:polyribonucleotide nucleotidyltransferase [Candidatus Marinamargulisbacteria bacterium SCGC AG-439-L15]
MNKETVKQSISGSEITLETGILAKQANGSVILRCGDMVLLCTATMSKQAKEGIDFFPLTIEYVEKMYAAGRIPGGFFKRETRPHTSATLIARLIDRPLRPMFPKGFHNDVQIAITVLSYDETVVPDHLSIIGASAALSISNIPLQESVGAALVCEVDGQLKVNPPKEEVDRATLDIIVAGTKDAVLMIEAGASEVSEERIIEAIQLAHASIKETVALQESLTQKVSTPKIELSAPETDAALESKIKDLMGNKIQENLQSGQKHEVETFLSELETTVVEACVTEDPDNSAEVKRLFGSLKKQQIRQSIISQKVRPDGRALDEIRPIHIDLGGLPSVHGAATFTRGETQSLGVVTLGSVDDEQINDSLTKAGRENYFFHYNFPPYSVGEVGFMGRTGRRELGHGALAERALRPILPSKDAFPYTMRIVSEILESNGSSSMASVCSGSLSLMDCGVPTKASVSGIAMGLLMDESGEYTVLSDIQGLEDHYGDMDFKVAGTREGVTALQLDIKISGLSEQILREALEQAKKGRLHILDKMDAAITEPRTELSEKAPKIHSLKIDGDKIGLLIGPGGKNIRGIEEETSAKVAVIDGTDGEVTISAPDSDSMKAAIEMVNGLVKDLEPGDVYQGKVVKIMNFGAFLSLGKTGKEALLHISKIADHRVENIEEYIKEGDEFPVKVEKVDDNGRISLVRAEQA